MQLVDLMPSSIPVCNLGNEMDKLISFHSVPNRRSCGTSFPSERFHWVPPMSPQMSAVCAWAGRNKKCRRQKRSELSSAHGRDDQRFWQRRGPDYSCGCRHKLQFGPIGGFCTGPETIACLSVISARMYLRVMKPKTRMKGQRGNLSPAGITVTNNRTDSYRKNAILMNLKNYSQ